MESSLFLASRRISPQPSTQRQQQPVSPSSLSPVRLPSFFLSFLHPKQPVLLLAIILFQFQWQEFHNFCCSGSSVVDHHHHNNRPKPSHDIASFIHLQEIPGSRYDPRSINHAKLKHKLGPNYDPEFMSIYPPIDFNTTIIANSITSSTSTSTHSKNKHSKKQQSKSKSKSGEHKKGSARRNFNDVIAGSGSASNLLDYSNIPAKFHGRLRFKFIKKLEKFLQVYTACPLIFKWKDLGVRFWPRYLKEGYCQLPEFNSAPSSSSSAKLKSCSIPPGLYCQPSQQVYKVLLRWHCQNWEHRKRCRWLEIRYPIITGCSCGTCVNVN